MKRCHFHNGVFFSYDTLMLSCWRADPKERPPFSDLVNNIESILTKVAQYLDINEYTLMLDHSSEDKSDNQENENNSMVDLTESSL